MVGQKKSPSRKITGDIYVCVVHTHPCRVFEVQEMDVWDSAKAPPQPSLLTMCLNLESVGNFTGERYAGPPGS